MERLEHLSVPLEGDARRFFLLSPEKDASFLGKSIFPSSQRRCKVHV
jgi:hypothetical protein